MEKPQNYLSRLRRHPLLWNLALIAAIILAMAVAAHILMQLGTRHGARRTVPDLSGVQLDQAQRIARKHESDISRQGFKHLRQPRPSEEQGLSLATIHFMSRPLSARISLRRQVPSRARQRATYSTSRFLQQPYSRAQGPQH